MKKLFCTILSGIVMTGASVAQSGHESDDVATALLTREGAVQRALSDSPQIAAAKQAVRAAEAGVRQAKLRPNPTLDLELEDFSGTGRFDGTGAAQATYSLRQKIELGGDRKARTLFAEHETAAARISAGLSVLDMREAVELAFVEAQAAEAYATVAKQRQEITRNFAGAVDRRVRAARDSKAAKARVDAQVAEAEVAVEAANVQAKAARAALASYWNGAHGFSLETATFFNPPSKRLKEEGAPDIALVKAKRDAAAARVDIERAKRTPDPDVTAGFRQIRQARETAFVVGVSVPLPIWNRNSNAVARARAEKARAEFEVDARTRELARDVSILAAEAHAAEAQNRAYADRIIPSSEKAYEQSLHAYRQGGLSYIEVLDAQSSLADARMRQISALLTLHRARIQLSRRISDLSSEEFQENVQ